MRIILKFGGASIKDDKAIKNVGHILHKYKSRPIIIVFSAIAKVTNMLEEIVGLYVNSLKEDMFLKLQKLKDFHFNLVKKLFHKDHEIHNIINNLFVEIEWVLEEEYNGDYDYIYDQIVSVGELLSSNIMSAYCNDKGINNNLIDARDLIKTNADYRFAKVNWEETISSINNIIKSRKTYITQGFIGGTTENCTTTLGREGSDFTAAILAYGLDAKELIVWKDVPGIMNADPNLFNDAEKILSIPFHEAIELAFYGAKVIHPNTIQPLQTKNIPLRVKSFINPDLKGTTIIKGSKIKPLLPFYIVKENQILISISDPLLSFIVEEHLSNIFFIFSKHNIRINMMQHSAVSFSVCLDHDKYKIPKVLDDLQSNFNVVFNEGLTLYTIRHYNQHSIDKILKGKELLLEQKTRNTIHLVLK
ncbi:MAG: aspartate kinase [Bacteroidota bacterium]|nr:aspartate kinase [Bacteroidota bacterium]